jgi:hypothetical protein
MDLSGFLKFHKLDLETLSQGILDRVKWQPGDTLYLSGSVVEGIGNKTSDLDAFLVTERRIESYTFDNTIILPFRTFAVDIEVWDYSQVSTLVQTLCSLPASEDRDPRKVLRFNLNELTFLHRLAIGIPIAGPEMFLDLHRSVDRRAISRIIFDQAAAIIPAQATDIAGLLDEGDFDSAVVSAQRLLGYTIDAVMAVQGNTNPSQKWRLRKVQQFTEQGLSHPLPVSLKEVSSYPDCRDLFLMRCLDSENFTDYVHGCVRLGRHAIPWGQQIFIPPAIAPHRIAGVSTTLPPPDSTYSASGSQSLLEIDDSRKKEYLPRLSADAMVRWCRGELSLYNSRSEIEVGIGEVALAALLYFDGRTTIAEALKGLASVTPIEQYQVIQALLDLRTLLAKYSFFEAKDHVEDLDLAYL